MAADGPVANPLKNNTAGFARWELKTQGRTPVPTLNKSFGNNDIGGRYLICPWMRWEPASGAIFCR